MSSRNANTINAATPNPIHASVLKNGPNTKNAMAFLEFFVKGASEHVPFSAKVSFDSNNREAAGMIPADERKYRPSWPENWSKLVIADYEWIAANRDRLRERWTTWVTK